MQLQGRVQYYFDSRDFNTLNVTNRISGLPFQSDFFGYTNFNGRQDRGSQRFDIRETASEYRLTSYLPGSLLGSKNTGLFAEVNYNSPGRRSIGRFGVAHKLFFANPFFDTEKKYWIQARVAAIETDGSGQQVGSSFGLPVIDKFFFNGFLDYNYEPGSVDRWIGEMQANLVLLPFLSLVVEYRYNGFFAAAPSKKTAGWAPGIRFDYQF